MKNMAFWLTQPTFPHVEIAHDFGFRAVVLDIEHGTFNLDDLDRLIPFCKALGMKVYAKVLGPQAEAIQQALDFGADAVVIPHIGDLAHATKVTAAAKYPPLGNRSLSGGRTFRYAAATDDHNAAENKRILCLPMVESAEALEDVEKILALPTVDGVFLGPTDLFLSRGAKRYAFSEDDKKHLIRIAKAAKAAGKLWVFPAWTAPERALAKEYGADTIIVGPQFALVRAAFAGLVEGLKSEGII